MAGHGKHGHPRAHGDPVEVAKSNSWPRWRPAMKSTGSAGRVLAHGDAGDDVSLAWAKSPRARAIFPATGA